ncbi:unnamed protein product [Didymodactylos carnosus]|uniref:Periplasmic beta-glucosidase n=2 Tax=Didymodactylos carnosus TaxID=1234261 RepID=A0A8S2DPL8_9BILA|nr:unnamed protein product [Didymodactylos carnosus]CAF3769789.1 unnamed protein product [Didymodactylos carnosus]
MQSSVLIIFFVHIVSGLNIDYQITTMNTMIDRLIEKMTLEEKIGQLNLISIPYNSTRPIASKNEIKDIENGLVGGVFNSYTPDVLCKIQKLAVKSTRLHIPLIFGLDVIHGHRTIFPIPLGISCSWDMTWIERSAQVAAQEASADGLHWTFSPMVDIARDPRWGRIAEGAGEDAYLGSQIAKVMVKGYQGNDLAKNNTIMACVKHFALYGAVEGGREYNTVDMSRIRMYQDYLPPYHAAVDAGVGSVMTAFNEINGIPASGSKWLVDDLLRGQWGFSGLVITDYMAINEMIVHGIGDLKHVSALALKSGVDMDMVSNAFLDTLNTLLKKGVITQRQIDTACRKVLEAKYKLGLFDDPYRYCDNTRAQTEILTDENRFVAKEVAKRSIVLLKNAHQTLPLKRQGTIALIGPLVDDQRNVLGTWSAAGNKTESVSVITGIRNLVGGQVNIVYEKGANIIDDIDILKLVNAKGGDIELDKRSPEMLIKQAVRKAKIADVIVAVLGESQAMSGEAASRSDIGLPKNQQKLLKALVETGKPIVLVLMNGRPLTLLWESKHVDAILETWFAGTEAGNAIAEVLFGDYNPSGKLTASFPWSVGQIPVYYNHKNTGRPYNGTGLGIDRSRYLDIPNDPLYPFGYGLSYTTFKYGPLKVNKRNFIGDNEILTVHLSILNSGLYGGEETVQLYIHDPIASVTRAVKELKNFQKIFLKPKELKQVSFNVTVNDLKFYNSALKYIWETGEFIIYVGPNSHDVQSISIHWSM